MSPPHSKKIRNEVVRPPPPPISPSTFIESFCSKSGSCGFWVSNEFRRIWRWPLFVNGGNFNLYLALVICKERGRVEVFKFGSLCLGFWEWREGKLQEMGVVWDNMVKLLKQEAQEDIDTGGYIGSSAHWFQRRWRRLARYQFGACRRFHCLIASKYSTFLFVTAFLDTFFLNYFV